MAESGAGFYVTLPSNSSMTVHPTNKPQAYTVELAQPIVLEGNWEMALMEMQYPNNWFNVTKKSTWNVTIEYLDRDGERLTEEEYDNGVNPLVGILKSKAFRFEFGPGNFSSIEKICRAITEKLCLTMFFKFYETRNVKTPFSFVYNEVTRRVVTRHSKFFQSTVMEGAEGSGELARILGFSTDESETANLILGQTGKNEASIMPNYPAVFVYCDVVEHQIVGDTKAPLLRTVPLVDKNQEVVGQSFVRPYYIPVKKNYIRSIEIELRNDSGQLIKFQSGKSILVLHFRRCGLNI